MNFTHLQYFKVLAEIENMTHASNKLHVAQPALSRALSKLEKDMGVPLFNRSGKNIILNDNGRILLHHVNIILQEVEEVRKILSDKDKKSKKQVSVSMYAGTPLLPDIIRGFSSKHPDISLIITQQGLSQDCDISILSSSKNIEKKGCITLLEEDICLAVPSSHPLSKCKKLSLSQVANESFIGLHKGSGLRNITDEYCQKAGFLPKVVWESDSPAIMRDLISLGIGLAFIPKISWAGVYYGDNVTLLDIDSPNCARYIYMSCPENRYISKAAKTFQKYLVNFFENMKN